MRWRPFPAGPLAPVIALALALALAGCCSRKPDTDFNRFDGTANQAVGLCGIFSGFGTREEPARWSAVYSPISKEEYGQLLCGQVDPLDYASCVNRTWSHYRQGQREPDVPGESTSGPFAVLFGPEILLGSYWSNPFAARFRVSNTQLSCEGQYDAFQGDTEAVFKVLCSNGQRGRAQIVRDQLGRDGMGAIYLDDGTQGRIVFGHDILSAAAEARAERGAGTDRE